MKSIVRLASNAKVSREWLYCIGLTAIFLLAGSTQVWGEAELKKTITLSSYDENPWTFPTTATTESSTYTYNGTSITIEGGGSGNGHKLGSQARAGGHYDYFLIMGKNGATLTLPEFSFKTTKIIVAGRTGASSSVEQNIFVGSTAVSTATTGASSSNTYEINSSYQAPGTIYKLQVTSAHNTQITSIEIWGEDACDKSVTINKGTSTNCSFALSKSGAQASCSGVSTTVTVTPNTGYGTPVVTQSGASAAPSITGSGNSWTVSYSANTTGTSAINVSCSAKTYTLTLNGNSPTTEGTASVTATYNSATLSSAITNPQKTHYDFDGFYTGSGGTGTKVINANGELQANVTGYTGAGGVWTRDENTTLYAKWIEHTLTNYRTVCCDEYDITLTGEGTATGGTFEADYAKACESKAVGLYAYPSKGYEFTEWIVTDEEDNNITDTNVDDPNSDGAVLTMPASDVTVNATFTAKSYSLVFDKNEGTADGGATATYNSSTLASITTATRTGEWALLGYFTESEGGTKVVNADGTLVTDVSPYTDADGKWIYDDDEAFYAQWRSTSTNRVTITAPSNGSISVTYTGMESALTSGYRDIDQNTVLTISATPSTGYLLGGLTVDEDAFTSGNTYTLTKDITIAATFTPIDYTITYGNMEGATNHKDNPASYTIADEDIVFDEPTKEGYTFAGWYSDNGVWEDEVVGIESGSTGNVTVYAKWTINSYTLSWSTDGDALTGDYTTGSVEYGATITAPNTPTKTGYTFASWSPTPDATMPAGNTTYTATWTINNYTVKWSVNGDDSYSAGVTSENDNADYNTTISTLPTPPADNTLSACANKFMGWSTKNFTYTSGKDDTDYDDLFTDETPAITANTTFYAVFAEQLGADVNTVVWSEDFSSYDAADVPSGSVTTATGRKVYNNGNVTYYCTNGDGTSPGATKVASESLAAGTSPELFIGKKGTGGTTGGSFRIVGIPRAGAKELTLTYKQNANQLLSLVSGTSYSGGLDSKVKQEQEVTITCGTDPTFTLTFQATTTNNVRLDDIVIKVKTINYGNYVTQCNPSQARVDYDANGGHTSCENGSQDKEGFTLCEEEPERTGYDFQGWLSSEDSKVYAASDEYELDNAVTFTAQWTASTYTINYYDQGGAEYSGTNSGSLVGTHTYDSETVLVAGEKGAAYHFDGWFTNSACTGSPITTIGATAYTSGPISLYAKWTTMHQITWTVVGGGDPAISYFLPDAELTFPSPAPSAPTGSKVFIGWTSEELTCETDDEPEMVDAGSAVTDDATYYAVFGKSSGGTPIAATEDDEFTTSGVESYCGMSNGMKDEGDYILNNGIWNASNMTNVKVRIKVYHVSNKISDVLRISLINSSGEEISGTDLNTTEFGSNSASAGYSEYVDIIPTTAVTGYKISLKTKNSNGTAVDKVTREVVPIYTRYATDTYCKEFTPVGESTSWSETGNWGGAIPTADNIVHITKQMTVDVTNAVAKEIIIDQSDDATGQLTIAADQALVVTGKIQVEKDGVLRPTTAADLKVESSAAGNGTLIFENDGNAATVEMYSIGSTDGWKWQYIGVPFEGANAQATYYGAYLYKWNNGWTAVQKSDDLEMFAGYCISYPAANYTYVMDGALAPTTSKSITVPEGKSMVVGNSWTAPIQITQLEEEDFSGLLKNVYLYNTGNDKNHSATTTNALTDDDDVYAAGTYISVPIHSAEYTDVKVISSLQGFFVKDDDTQAGGGTLSLNYSKHVRPAGGNSVVNGAMHAPKRVADETDRPAVLKMKVSGSQYDDRLILLEREDFTTGYDAGWDGDKMGDVATSPRITTTREDGTADAVAALPDLEGTLINFRAASTDDQYTLYFDYETEDAEPLYLLDLTNNAYTRVETGSSYTFFTTDKADHKRFALTRYRAPQITTGVEDASEDNGQGKAVKFIENDKLYILRNGVLYDGTGKRAK